MSTKTNQNEPKIIDYKIISNTYPDELARLVNYQINLGWQPYNSPFHAAGNKILQVMVMYE
jgi:hypothetical protein